MSYLTKFAALAAGILASIAVLASASAQTQSLTRQCVATAVAGGTADALTVPQLPCSPTSTLLLLTFSSTNTTPNPTLQAVGMGAALPLKFSNSAAMTAGALVAGNMVLVTSNGLSWQIISTTSGAGIISSGSSPQIAQYQGTGQTSIAPVTVSGDGTLAPGGALTITRTGGTAFGPLATSTSLSAAIDSQLGATRGAIIERGASGWALVGPGTTGQCWTSNGLAADPSYQPCGSGGNGITQLTGDGIAGPGTGSQALAISAIGGKAVTLAGAFTTTGAASGLIFAAPGGGPFTFTLPIGSATLASTTLAETFQNKTINCANNTCSVRVASDISGFGTGIAAWLATPSLANWATAMTGLGTGVATWMATPSSANLASAVTGATGSGALVFGTSPALATPTISGAAVISGQPSFTNALSGSPNRCLGLDSGNLLTASALSGPNCGGGGGTVVYTGTTTNSGNHYTITSPNPSSPAFALTNQNSIKFVASADNTAAADLNAAGTGAVAIKTNTGGGFVALAGGEIRNGNEYEVVYNSTCSCFVKMNETTTASNFGAASQTITQAQWVSGTELDVTVAAQTFTLPASTTLSPAGGLLIDALLASAVVTPNAADVIKCGNVALAAGASLTIPLGSMTKLTTDGAGVIGVSPGSCSGGTLVATVVAGGTGQSTYVDGQLLIGDTSTGGLGKATITAGSGITVTNANHSITVAASGGGGGASVNAPQGRLTCTSGSPVMTADVTACTTIYYDCYVGNAYPFYTGAADSSATITACEMSDALPNSGTGVVNSGDLFDEWIINGFLCHATNGSGGGWSSDTAGSTTARGTGYTQVDATSRPYLTNKNAIAHCYAGATDKGSVGTNQATLAGTFYTTAAGTTKMQFTAAAAAGGSDAMLGLYNAYNGEIYTTRSLESTASWTYGTAAWRSAQNSASNRIRYVDGLARSFVRARYSAVSSVAGGVQGGCTIGVNLNSTSTPPTVGDNLPATSNGTDVTVTVEGNFPPSIGLNSINALENARLGVSCTWYGTASIAGGNHLLADVKM